jgi:dipeptidyl aminopeptidase/acylaminoacyl peptidase
VLLPNPRGGIGRGRDFARRGVGDVGGGEVGDVLSGVDACVAAGVADGERLGIAGLSHGGYLTAWTVTQTRRFRAAVAMSCISNWLSFRFTSNIGGGHDRLWLGADPLTPDGLRRYAERSPVFHAHHCTTPTLIVHGALDRGCPLGQAEELFAALREARVPTELVVYPREGHVWQEREHQLDCWRRALGWFDRHLLS